MSAPREVVIDQLVLRGVSEPDAPHVIAAFRRHLADLLTSSASAHDELPRAQDPHSAHDGDIDKLGRDLALSVARAVQR